MNDDLISKVAAFDSVEIFLKQTDAPEVYPGLIPALARVINNVPSAQQVRTQMSSADDLISRHAAIDILDVYQVMVENGEGNPYAWARLRMSELPSAQPTLYGYNIEHLALIATVLQKEDLPPERVVEAVTDIGRIASIIRAECEEELKKAVERCMI